jgi:hypothetical protein
MALTAGIVGLPNVGKSTLFNAITKSSVTSANYPFATIDPNVGVTIVPDERVDVLADMYDPDNVVHTTFEFTDVAGLVRGASKGEGLGNQFLAHIREVDAICQVVRCFDDPNVTHVDGSINPTRDIETIQIELIMADIDTIERRLPKIKKKASLKTEKDVVREYELLKIIHAHLMDSKPIRSLNLSDDDKKRIRHFNFLTQKPMLYVCNVSEDAIAAPFDNDYVRAVKAIADDNGSKLVPISAKIEQELSQLDDEDRQMFLSDMGLDHSGLTDLIHASYEALCLKTFFTAGKKEVRAWTFREGMKAPACAGIIHSDFEKGFIRAETIAYDDLVEAGSEAAAKRLGTFRLEGKDYVVKDGDVMHFRFNT